MSDATSRYSDGAALLTAGTFVGLGFAQGGSDGVINACAFDRFGWLRLVDDPLECGRHETPISWNTQGPPGPQGEPGPPGAFLGGRFQFTGFTQSTYQGDQGVFGFTEACQIDFPDSRMCSLGEVWETTALPESLVGDGWVWPGSDVSVFNRNDICGQWTTNHLNSEGRIVASDSVISVVSCDEFHSVACCAPR